MTQEEHIAALQARNTELVEENRRLNAAIPIATPAAMVRAFHQKYGFPVNDRPQLRDKETSVFRYRLLREEFEEYTDAERMRTKPDLIEIADALADMVYVIYGTAITYGIDLDAVVAEVHRSNMTKTASGSTVKKVLKGPGYEPPAIAAILHRDAGQAQGARK